MNVSLLDSIWRPGSMQGLPLQETRKQESLNPKPLTFRVRLWVASLPVHLQAGNAALRQLLQMPRHPPIAASSGPQQAQQLRPQQPQQVVSLAACHDLQ